MRGGSERQPWEGLPLHFASRVRDADGRVDSRVDER